MTTSFNSFSFLQSEQIEIPTIACLILQRNDAEIIYGSGILPAFME